jgi:hypothetical protein
LAISCFAGKEREIIKSIFWSSSESGHVFDGPHFIEPVETTDAAPALAALGTKLYIAWKGTGNTTLNIGEVGVRFDSSGHGSISSFTGITNKVELTNAQLGAGNFQTATGPALVAHIQLLFLAWKGSGDNVINMLLIAPDFKTAITPTPISAPRPQYTASAPSLASHNESLFIAWRDLNSYLNVAPIAFDTSDDDTLPTIVLRESTSQKLVFQEDGTDAAPSLASVKNLLFLSWMGNANYLCMMASDNNAGSFVHRGFTLTQNGPCLTWNNDKCYLAWTDLNDNHLHVAYSGFYGSPRDLNLGTSSGRMIQDMGYSISGDFQVLVRQPTAPWGTEMHLWMRVNWDPTLPWQDGQENIQLKTNNTASLIQSNIGKPNYPGNFEALVVSGLRGAHSLEHWSRVSSIPPIIGHSSRPLAKAQPVPGRLFKLRLGRPMAPADLKSYH